MMNEVIKDADSRHWTYRLPKTWQPYAQLARYDRPIGYWLLALPGWAGLAFASLKVGAAWTDLKWAALIFIGAVAMRGAGCTYNDIIDRNLDAKVARTALRPIPAGRVSLQQAWGWLMAQCAAGLLVLLALPGPAQLIALASLPLVAAYPFMKRITWWPQIWLGLTFNWAVLVAFAIKTGGVSGPAIWMLYIGLMFWTLGYDTIYACQDLEDDALIGVKSSARRMGRAVGRGVTAAYGLCLIFCVAATAQVDGAATFSPLIWAAPYIPFAAHLAWQSAKFLPGDGALALHLFKSNRMAGLLLCAGLWASALLI